jgi:hypothetical protein
MGSDSPLDGQTTLERLRKRRLEAQGEVLTERPALAGPSRVKPLELAVAVRQATRAGAFLVEALMEVAQGLAPMPVKATDPDTGEEVIRPGFGQPTASDRVRAVGMLKVWGWGKEVEHVQVETTAVAGAGSFDLERLSITDMQAFLDISRRARGAIAALPEDVVDVDARDVQQATSEQQEAPPAEYTENERDIMVITGAGKST